VTRDLILELRRQRHPCRETDITVEELAGADEIWLTSSTREISPVIRLDDRPSATANPARVNRMIRLYQNYKEAVRQAWRPDRLADRSGLRSPMRSGG
jgi:D-alanine transaminase